MASEIRVLEDQLYEADYENRVLRDQVEKYRSQLDESPTQTLAPPAVVYDPPIVDAFDPIESKGSPKPRDGDMPDRPSDVSGGESSGEESSPDEPDGGIDIGMDEDEFALPSFDDGELVDPDALTDPPSAGDTVPEGGGNLLPPAPGGPEPPGKSDTEIPQVDPGEILPPPVSEEDQVQPPGQIRLPDSAQASAGIPESIRIHPSLSGGHRVEGEVREMIVVVNVLDRLGKTVDVTRFDIAADLSVVIIDPDRDPSDSKLGRWDVPMAKVSSLIRSEPISGLHIPIAWKESRPSGEEVIVHVRLRAEEDEMRCQQRIRVDRQPAVAEWTPRGESLR